MCSFLAKVLNIAWNFTWKLPIYLTQKENWRFVKDCSDVEHSNSEEPCSIYIERKTESELSRDEDDNWSNNSERSDNYIGKQLQIV